MNDVAIRVERLRKVYRLYTQPHYRLLDMFGLLRDRSVYSEHVAIEDVSLEIGRGEKVALIGRNGAGKSTLLKLITQVTAPTAGTIEVRGKTHVLLQLGTGFHPDFTGRENVYAYLAHLGITGARADEHFAEIVEFAELEEYINQPLKTYSTGMGVRLMFATSTALVPEILVLDEVLGVGDAYFAQKSFRRITELCRGRGTTVILVSHDLYSASRLCERVIWIDRGRVIMDRDAPTVIMAYEDSIREQEERRLRARNRRQLAQLRGRGEDSPAAVLIEVRAAGNRPQPASVYFSRITLYSGEAPLASLPLGPGEPHDPAASHLDLQTSCWGEPLLDHGRQARPMCNYGSPFHKAAGVLSVPGGIEPREYKQLALRLEYRSDKPCDLVLRAFIEGREFDLGRLPPSDGQWHDHRADWPRADDGSAPAEPLPEINTTGAHGTRRIAVHEVRAIDAAGRQTQTFAWGGPLVLELGYEVLDPALRQKAQVLVALHRDGVQDVCRFLTRDLEFDHRQPRGTIAMRIERLQLAPGTYTVTVMVAEEGYYDREQTVFYTINPGVYTCLSRVMEIVVAGGGLFVSGTMMIGEAQWNLHPAAAEKPPAGREPVAHAA